VNPVAGILTKQEIPGNSYSLLGADGNDLVYQAPAPGAGITEAWFHQPGH